VISVKQVSEADPLEFEVVIDDDSGESRHEVTMSRQHFGRLSVGASAEQCIEAAFRFLLDREPKEAILRRFDVSVISRYFPEFEAELPGYITRAR